MDVHLGYGTFDHFKYMQVGFPRIFGVNSTLHANLSCTPFPAFGGPTSYFFI